jgi:hypothetical protein
MDREANIENALQAFKEGKFRSLRAAAREFGVPPTTLDRRAKGATSRRTSNEHNQACSPAEEKAIIDWLQRCQKQGFPIHHDMLKAMAEYLIAKRNLTNRRNTLTANHLSHNWPSRFIARHPDLLSIMSKPIDHARTERCTRKAFEKWFKVYRHALRTHRDALSNIYNMDETGFQMGDGAKSYVVVDKCLGTTGYVNTPSKTENVTVIECGCMDGTVLPPFTVFKGKNLQSTWFPEQAPDN